MTRGAGDNTSSTSPSIYANFYGIRIDDLCGACGSVESIPTTMLTFTPGELSTMVGLDPEVIPALGWVVNQFQPFNFADLPCPPRSIAVRLIITE